VTSLSRMRFAIGSGLTISVSNFSAAAGTATFKFNGTTATPTSWSATSLVVPVPVGATTGTVIVTVGGLASNALTFTVLVPPSVKIRTPSCGQAGHAAMIAGPDSGTTTATSTGK